MLRKARIIGFTALLLLILTTFKSVQAQDSRCPREDREGVYLYEDENYRGRCSFFSTRQERGSPPLIVENLSRTIVGNNTASSIRIVGNYRANLYVRTGLSGTETIFAGDDPNFEDDPIGVERASSLLVTWYVRRCDRGDGVYLFSNANCQGRATRITSDIADLSTENIGVRTASSLAMRGDYAVTVFPNPNFHGEPSVFVTSDRDFSDDTIGDNGAVSVRIRESRCDDLDDLPGVYLYEHSNNEGRCSKFRSDISNLTFEYVKNDNASSIWMIGDYIATVFQHADYRGADTATTFNNEDLNFGNNPISHDNASSIRVRPRNTVCDGEVGVYLYEEANFRGRCSKFTDDKQNLANSFIGEEAASSIRIVGNYRAIVYSETGFGGAESTFEGDDPNFRDDAIGNEQASSIAVIGPYPEDNPVLRAQIRLVTAEVEDAQTDDDVVISLNPENATWLDYGLKDLSYDEPIGMRDDFGQGHDFTYDLLIDGVSFINDIDWLTITKTGSDGWCIELIELYYKGVSRPIYSRVFSPCQWLDNEGGSRRQFAISYSQLRSYRGWAGLFDPETLKTMTQRELESRIEGLVGHFLHYFPAGYWGEVYGRDYVEVENREHDNRTLHVDLDLQGDVFGPDPEVDIDFDLQISCNEGRISLDVLNVNAEIDLPWYVEFLSFMAGGFEEMIEQGFPNVSEEFNLPGGACPTIMINGDWEEVQGYITFDLSRTPEPTPPPRPTPIPPACPEGTKCCEPGLTPNTCRSPIFCVPIQRPCP